MFRLFMGASIFFPDRKEKAYSTNRTTHYERNQRMMDIIFEKFKESAQSVLPVSTIVLCLHFTIAPMSPGTLMLFLTGSVLLIIGMSIFTLGSDMAMIPMGEAIGLELTKSRNLPLIIIGGFLLGVVVTVAEPDLQVLTKQVPAVPDMVLILSVAVGVGVFLVLSLLRIILRIDLAHMFIGSYLLVFVIAAFTAPDYLAVAFDSGGVTTGPITVPFILSLGMGVSSVLGGKNSEEDSFGLCALCSIGPILAVLVTGMFYNPSSSGFAFEAPGDISGVRELFSAYGKASLGFFGEVCLVLLPILIIFSFFQILRLKFSTAKLIKILVGIVYTIIGLAIFLTGVNVGFMPAGKYLGKSVASLPHQWILIPLSAVIGFFVVFAEPAVHVLNNQVEDITSGAISQKMMMAGLSIGVSIALVLSMIRIMAGLNIWFFLVPGYILALVLTFFTPKSFIAIAFDSGGVAAGTMAAAFLLPFAEGVCDAFGADVMTGAFGIIAMVAMMPLITIQVMGLIYKVKMRSTTMLEESIDPLLTDNTIIDVDSAETGAPEESDSSADGAEEPPSPDGELQEAGGTQEPQEESAAEENSAG